MANTAKHKAVKQHAEKYEEKTPIKGTFLEIMLAAEKHANDNSAKRKEQ